MSVVSSGTFVRESSSSASLKVLMIATAVIAMSQTALTEKELSAYSKAGSIAEEVLSSIRTVVSFGGQKKEVDR